jgi:hypothetical protein
MAGFSQSGGDFQELRTGQWINALIWIKDSRLASIMP